MTVYVMWHKCDMTRFLHLLLVRFVTLILCVTWRLCDVCNTDCTCEKTYTWHAPSSAFACSEVRDIDSMHDVWVISLIFVTRLTGICDVTQSVCDISLIRATWLTHTCDMTHPYMSHDSLIFVTRLTGICDVTHFTYDVTRSVYMWRDTLFIWRNSYVWYDSLMYVTWLTLYVTWLTHCICDVTPPWYGVAHIYMWRDTPSVWGVWHWL